MDFLGYLYFWVAFSNMAYRKSKAWFDFPCVLVVLFKGKPEFKNKQTGSYKSQQSSSNREEW